MEEIQCTGYGCFKSFSCYGSCGIYLHGRNTVHMLLDVSVVLAVMVVLVNNM